MQSISLTIKGQVHLLTREEVADLGKQFENISTRAQSVRQSWEPLVEKNPGIKNPVSRRLVTAIDTVADSLLCLSADMDPVLVPRANNPV